MTKVFAHKGELTRICKLAVPLIFYLPLLTGVAAQDAGGAAKPRGPAETLYLQLSEVGLDPARVFHVRGGALDRPTFHIALEDGTMAFTKDVLGRITGAFFEGDGEILLTPPNEVERRSMSLFTGMAILEERFTTAYFRFNDGTEAELKPGLRDAEDAAAFVARWDATARKLAEADAMRLLATLSETLPAEKMAGGAVEGAAGNAVESVLPDHVLPDRVLPDHVLHLSVLGNTLGRFDVLFDSTAGEQVEAGQLKASEGGALYYDVWSSYAIADAGAKQRSGEDQAVAGDNRAEEEPFTVSDYRIDARIRPPKELDAQATLRVEVRRPATRFLAFELSRYLKIQSVECDGEAVEFIQNPAMEGTRLARSGNDVVAIVLPAAARKGQALSLRFVYGGEVLAEAGKGLLYVGERGTWYPNRGFSLANFDVTFHYPRGWTLLATGKAQASAAVGEEAGQVARWVTERPIPVAGFDLGKYVRAAVKWGNVNVEAYATTGVERDFPKPEPQPGPPANIGAQPQIPSGFTAASAPSPARNAMSVAQAAARAVGYYSDRFGPYPYSQLALTQLPGRESQGWPGLVFLSSYAFLNYEERQDLHMNAVRALMVQQIPAHETAHQWWGNLVTWKTYRDQWFSEGLANYCALMILQEKDPAGFREIMEKYRRDLVEKDKDGNEARDAGPVTLGTRLLSSRFPQGYEAISYGRGTWLFHMLRSMMEDAAEENGGSVSSHGGSEEPFVRSLRKLRERYEGQAITTRELLNVFAEDLPPSLRYEGKASLGWFLESWVNGTALPALELQGVKFAPRANGVMVSGTIRQKDQANDLVSSVPVYAAIPGKAPRLLGRVFADGPETGFHFAAPLGTHKVMLDPNETVLTRGKGK